MEKLDKQYDYRRSLMMNVFSWHAEILFLCESVLCVFYSNSGKNACATYAKMRARMKAENLTLAEYVAKGGTAE